MKSGLIITGLTEKDTNHTIRILIQEGYQIEYNSKEDFIFIEEEQEHYDILEYELCSLLTPENIHYSIEGII
jgi:hypothetical protein